MPLLQQYPLLLRGWDQISPQKNTASEKELAVTCPKIVYPY